MISELVKGEIGGHQAAFRGRASGAKAARFPRVKKTASTNRDMR